MDKGKQFLNRLPVLLSMLLCLILLNGCGGPANSASREDSSDPMAGSAIAAPSTDAGPSGASQESPESAENPYGLSYPPADPALEEAARHALDLANQGDFEALAPLFLPDETITPEILEMSFSPVLEALGAYKGYTDLPATQAVDSVPEMGELTGVLIECEYSEGFILWQVLFDADGEILSMTTVGAR